MDISFISGQDKFNYRVCAIILSGNRILAMHDERSPYYYLPGGRVRMGETAEHAAVREVEEELNIKSKDRPPVMAEPRLFHRRCGSTALPRNLPLLSDGRFRNRPVR